MMENWTAYNAGSGDFGSYWLVGKGMRIIAQFQQAEDINTVMNLRTALSQIAALQPEKPNIGDIRKGTFEHTAYAQAYGQWEAAQIAQAALGEGEGKEVQGE